VEGLMGAAAIRNGNFSGEIADASTVPPSHRRETVNGSTDTFSIPASRNFFAAQSTARSHAADPVGRPPTRSHNSRVSSSIAVLVPTRAASFSGAVCAAKPAQTSKHKHLWLVIPVYRPFLHDEEHLLRLADILGRVSRHDYDVRQLPGFQRAQPVGHPQQIRIP